MDTLRSPIRLLNIFVLTVFLAACGGPGAGTEPGTLQFSAATYSGNEDSGDITVTVTRAGGSSGSVSVDVSDATSGTAGLGTDYIAISTTTLNWADGDTADKTLVVSPIADGSVETDETVDLTLANVVGATLGTTTATTVTIVNDDAAVAGTLQFSPSSYTAAETGGGTATITVTRTGGDTGAVGVNYSTSDNTATAGSDYTAASGTLSWADGVSSAQTFTVTITNDTDVEGDEIVDLTLSGETGGATLGTSTATLTITSEDAYGSLQFSTAGYTVDETDGTVTNVITLQRVNGSSGAVTVDVSDLVTGSATGLGTDYTFTSPTTVIWADGDTADKNVTIALVDDGDVEGNETVDLSLGNNTGGASIGTPSTATVTIVDDDAPPAGELQFNSSSYSVAEDGGSVTITVERVNGSGGAVGVSYATSNGTATAGSDYTATSSTLSWTDGETAAKTFTVNITNDTDVEGDETVNLALSAPTGGATLGTPSAATLTINYNDTNLTMDIGDGTYWVAFRDGPGGTWAQWSPTSGNTYDFPVTDGSGRYGVAFHRQESDGINTVEKTYVIHATVGELANLNVFNKAKYTVSGTLSNYTGISTQAQVFMQHKFDIGLTDPYSYSLPSVSEGNRDLLAFELESDTVPGEYWFLRRNISVTGNLTNQDVDFTNDTDRISIIYTYVNSLSGSSADQMLAAFFATANGTVILTGSGTYDGVTPITYISFDTLYTQSGDAYSFQISNASGTKYRIRNRTATTDPGDRSYGLGTLASFTTAPTVNTTETTGLSYTPDPTSFGGSPVFRGFQINLDQTVAGVDGGIHWQIKISNGWLGASTSYTHPSLSSISGFNTGWDMSSGTLTNATVSAATTNSGTGLSLITRKTMGRSSLNLDPYYQLVMAMKLAQKDTLKADISNEYSTFTW